MKAKLKSPVKSLDQSILVKNEQITRFYAPHHYHSDYEIIYIKKSFGIRIIGNNIDNYQAGDVVILGPGLPHYHVVGENKKESENYIETIAVLFPQSIIESNSKFPEFAQINSTLEKLKYGIKLKKQTKKSVQKLLEQMSINPTAGNYFLLFSILETLAAPEATYTPLSTVQYDNKKLYNQKTKHILEYIADNYLSTINIEHVA